MCRASAYDVPFALEAWIKHRKWMIGFIDNLFEDPANSTSIVQRGLDFVVNNTSVHEKPSILTDNACWELHKCLGDLASAGWIEYYQWFEDFLQQSEQERLQSRIRWDEDLEGTSLINSEVEYARGMAGWAALPGH